MLSDVLFIVSMTAELFVLNYFVKYTIKYFKRYQEVVDPYTKWTLILLLLSLVLQLARLPVSAMNIASELETDPNSEFKRWFLEHSEEISRLLQLDVFFHGIIQKTAILINILRWQILVINL